KKEILDRLEELTEQAGSHYVPDFDRGDLTNKQEPPHMEDAFRSLDSLLGPEYEFIELFGDLLHAPPYSNIYLNSVLGQKNQLVRSVYDRLVPKGEAIFQLYDYL